MSTARPRRSTTSPSRCGREPAGSGNCWPTPRRPCRPEPRALRLLLQHEVVAGLDPRLRRRAAVRSGSGLALLEPDDQFLLGAEDDVAVQVLRALLEEVGDQRLVAG